MLNTLLAALVLSGASAQQFPLTAEVGPHTVGDVGSFLLSRDGSQIAYLELRPGLDPVVHSAPSAGGGPDVIHFANDSVSFNQLTLSSDGNWLLAQVGSDILSSSLDGSTGTVLIGSGSLATTTTSGRALFWSWDAGLYDLWSVSLNRNVPVRGAEGLEAIAGSVFVASDDGTLVVFEAREPGMSWGLYAVLSDGSGNLVRLSGDASYTSLGSCEITPDASRVVFAMDALTSGVQELYSAASDGTEPSEHLSETLAPGEEVQSFDLSSDGTRVVFGVGPSPFSLSDVQSVPVDGSSPPMSITGGLSPISEFLLSEASDRVVLAPAMETPIRVVPLDGSSSAVELPGSALFDKDLLGFTPDDDLVYWGFTFEPVATVCHRSQPLDGAVMPTNLLSDFPTGELASDGSSIVFPNLGQYWAVSTARPARPYPLHDLPFGGIESFVLAEEAPVAAFVGDFRQRDVDEVFATPVVRPSPVLVNGTLSSGGFVDTPLVTSDSVWVVFRSRGEGFYRDLRSVPLSGLGAEVLLSPQDHDVQTVALSPDGQRVVYVARDLGEASCAYVLSSPVDGSIAPVQISPASYQGTSVSFQMVPGGTYVLVDAEGGLYLGPVDGSSSPIELGPGQGPKHTPRLSADGSLLVYVTTASDELWSVPLDGTYSPVRLDGATFGISALEISGDGTRVLYTTLDTTPTYQNYHKTALLNGSGTPVTLGSGYASYLECYGFSPDSSWVWLLEDTDSCGDPVVATISAPDGSANGIASALLAGCNPCPVAVPDSSALLVTSSLPTDGLYRLPADGRPVVQLDTRLHGPNAAGGWDGPPFLLDDSGDWIVSGYGERISTTVPFLQIDLKGTGVHLDAFLGDPIGFMPGGDRLLFHGAELHQAPFDGSYEPSPLREPTAPGLPAEPVISPDGSVVVFVTKFFEEPPSVTRSQLFGAHLLPRATRVSPTTGLSTGGYPVLIRGRGMNPGIGVSFGGVPAVSVEFVSPQVIRAIVPPAPSLLSAPTGPLGSRGAINLPPTDVTLSQYGWSQTLEDAFTYVDVD